MAIKCASFFAGVGGIDLGFESAGFETVYANEIDPYPVETFEKNFNLKVDNRDIRDVMPEELPDFDVMIAGFPCQAFSIAGYREGFNDKKGRGDLFFELARILEIKKPKVVFLENVRNLETHDRGRTLSTIIQTLELKELGYHVKYSVLNAKDYGNIPQNRERIYIVGFLDEDSFNRFQFPDPVERTLKLEDIIDFDSKIDNQYYYSREKYKAEMMDEIEKSVNKKNQIYQWRRKYVRANKSDVCPTLTANMGTGGHNVPLIFTDYGIRKLTPRECFELQGFPKTFELPSDMSNGRLYKQAGNSVCVTVIKRIAENIKKIGFGVCSNE